MPTYIGAAKCSRCRGADPNCYVCGGEMPEETREVRRVLRASLRQTAETPSPMPESTGRLFEGKDAPITRYFRSDGTIWKFPPSGQPTTRAEGDREWFSSMFGSVDEFLNEPGSAIEIEEWEGEP